MKSIKTFIKRNKVLVTGLMISIVYIFIFVILKINIKDYDDIKLIMDVFYNLALAYCASLIFYIIQVYVPMVKNEKKVIDDLFSCLNDIYFYYIEAKKVIEEINCIVDTYKVVSCMPEKNIKKLTTSFYKLDKLFEMAELYMEKMEQINYSTKYDYKTLGDTTFEKIEEYKRYKIKLHALKQEEADIYNVKNLDINLYYKSKCNYYNEIFIRLKKVFRVYSYEDIQARKIKNR